jgi:hypothetical protein
VVVVSGARGQTAVQALVGNIEKGAKRMGWSNDGMNIMKTYTLSNDHWSYCKQQRNGYLCFSVVVKRAC